MGCIGTSQRIVILGAGGTGLLMADSVLRLPGKELVGFLDDNEQKKSIAGRFPVLGTLPSWKSLPQDCQFLSSLYGPRRNPEFYRRIQSLRIPGERWATIVDPTAVLSWSVTLGRGVYVGPLTVLEPAVCLADGSVMLGSVYVAHDSRIDTYTACANSVSIAGGVRVGSSTFVGANSTVREYVRIGDRAVVGMGAVVIHDVADGSVVAGNPSRVIETVAVPKDRTPAENEVTP